MALLHKQVNSFYEENSYFSENHDKVLQNFHIITSQTLLFQAKSRILSGFLHKIYIHKNSLSETSGEAVLYPQQSQIAGRTPIV